MILKCIIIQVVFSLLSAMPALHDVGTQIEKGEEVKKTPHTVKNLVFSSAGLGQSVGP